jgi:hypothetical protein
MIVTMGGERTCETGAGKASFGETSALENGAGKSFFEDPKREWGSTFEKPPPLSSKGFRKVLDLNGFSVQLNFRF